MSPRHNLVNLPVDLEDQLVQEALVLPWHPVCAIRNISRKALNFAILNFET